MKRSAFWKSIPADLPRSWNERLADLGSLLVRARDPVHDQPMETMPLRMTLSKRGFGADLDRQ